jgi:hypothetical protein
MRPQPLQEIVVNRSLAKEGARFQRAGDLAAAFYGAMSTGVVGRWRENKHPHRPPGDLSGLLRLRAEVEEWS